MEQTTITGQRNISVTLNLRLKNGHATEGGLNALRVLRIVGLNRGRWMRTIVLFKC